MLPNDPSPSLEAYLAEATRAFNTGIGLNSLTHLSAQLHASFAVRLRADISPKSDGSVDKEAEVNGICMLPSWIHTLPEGTESGRVLAMDVGGTLFRAGLVDLGNGPGDDDSGMEGEEVYLDGTSQVRGQMRIIKMRSWKIDNHVRSLRGHDFFDWMAARIEDVLQDPDIAACLVDGAVLPMGMAWSFPVEQTSPREVILLDMGKGFEATAGVIGGDLTELIMRACRKRNLPVSLDAIINDGSATLLSRAYQDPATRFSLILGTGTNMAVVLPISALSPSKFGTRPDEWFAKAAHDERLEAAHPRPGFQPFEMLIGGRYIGEIVRLVCAEGIEEGMLFGGEVPAGWEAYGLEAKTVAVVESDTSPGLAAAIGTLSAIHPLPSGTLPSTKDIHFVQRVASLVTRRAAAYLAAGIHALWELKTAAEQVAYASSGAPRDSEALSIACNGSIIERYPGFRAQVQSYLDQLVEQSTRGNGPSGGVRLEVADESAIFGAAVAAVACRE
ncbi:actin-like ATPase domain-containing protein [Trichodelitschia bisporula]|uniref:Phosphotransferase n=1 Tax=Trichodelitschia bisporula TaxID=703511 RepID=A0A6G1HJE9_9PEZI|nr:actin-like ATPase domain-containing protein [Trichodelitschia bisporula]